MMNEHLFGFISSIVAGIVTNGIQGVSHYITKETLQDHIANTIGAVQLLYEKEFDYLAGKYRILYSLAPGWIFAKRRWHTAYSLW